MDATEFGRTKLNQHLADGNIWWASADACYEGRASDGVTVSFGDTEDYMIRYLTDNPDPVNW